MTQGTTDQQVSPKPFIDVKKRVEDERQINPMVYSNLRLDLLGGGEHNISNVK